NGETVAKLATGEKATFHLNAGELIVGASLEGAGLASWIDIGRDWHAVSINTGNVSRGRSEYFMIVL
ncbi:hypothetical protein ACSLO9_34900, partial [Escherichia coli]